MTATGPKPWRRGFSVSVALSVFLHLALFGAVLLLLRQGPRLAQKRGEPLFVELPNVPSPAPRGNPALRDRGTPARHAPDRTVARAIPPAPAGVLAAPRVEAPAIREMPAPEPRVASVPRPEARPAPAVRERTPFVPRAEPRAGRPEPLPAAAREREDRLPPAVASAAKAEAPVARELPAPAPPRSEPSAAGPPAEAAATAARAALPPAVPAAGATVDRLAALRPHTPGGGLIGGHGGIEGEPVPLDTKDPKFSDYFEQLRRAIKEKWTYPREAAEKNIGGQLVLEFGIAKDGQLRFIDLRRSSGVAVLDDYAVNAVKLASPFPPIPDALSRTGIPVVAIFNYIIEGSLYNVLR